MSNNPRVVENAMDYIDAMLTPEELAESDIEVALMMEMVRARKERGITQRDLEQLSGVRQPVIARMERGVSSPQLSTVLKVLAALGLTLAIVPMKNQ